MKVLVTGADGFIGSHLTEALVRAGHDVRAFVLYNSMGSWGWLDRCAEDVLGNFEVELGDVRDSQSVNNAVKGCEGICHLAALIAIPYSYRAPQSFIDTNVTGTANVLQAARDFDVERVIHTSTSEVYGSAQFVPITEEHPLNAQSPYAASKIGADQIALSYERSFGTPVTVLRPFNSYGPRQSARAVIPTVITQLINHNAVVKLGSLHPTRDFNFVDDTVSAFLAALGADSTKIVGQVFNVGSNFEISIGETAQLIASILGGELNIEKEAERVRPETSEVDRLFCANGKAKAALGWEPKFSGVDGLRRGLERTIRWFSDRENLASYKAGIYSY